MIDADARGAATLALHEDAKEGGIQDLAWDYKETRSAKGHQK